MHPKAFGLLTLYEINQCITPVKHKSKVYYIINAAGAQRIACDVCCAILRMFAITAQPFKI